MPFGSDNGSPQKPLRFADAVNDLIAEVSELLLRDEFDALALEQVFQMRRKRIDPLCRFLQKHDRAKAAEIVLGLGRAMEEYAVCFAREPNKREERRNRVEAQKRLVRRILIPSHDREGEVEQLLDDIRRWHWSVRLDEGGRLAFATENGVSVPARRQIIREAGPQVIEQAVKAQRPYSDSVRPRDLRGQPGGLVVLKDVKRLIVVGDIHGRYDNLEHILSDRDILRSVIASEAHLVFIGDAVHPSSSRLNDDQVYEDSFCVMLLIMTLKAENPFNVHYILGNHDNAHVGGYSVKRGDVRQDIAFEEFFQRKLSPSIIERYHEFVLNCPVAVKAHGEGGAIVLVHATLSDTVRSAEGLTNVFLLGRKSKVIRDLLWSRDYAPDRIANCAARIGARFVVGGHTVPHERNVAKLGLKPIASPAFAQAGTVQLILNAQTDVFGYLDVDMTRPLPEDVGELHSPDGSSACHVLRRARVMPEAVDETE